jgi:hypothetical protein
MMAFGQENFVELVDDDDVLPLPASTKWYRDHGRRTRRERAAKEQYLTPNKDKELSFYVLRMSKNGYPLAVKVLRSLALVIRRRRGKAPDSQGLNEPGKNWPQGFYKRNPQLKSSRMRAMTWDRHDHTIYPKVTAWFSIISEELARPDVLAENVYNMDETGVLLGKLGSLKVLVGKNELRNYTRSQLEAHADNSGRVYICDRQLSPSSRDMAFRDAPKSLDSPSDTRVALRLYRERLHQQHYRHALDPARLRPSDEGDGQR